LTGAGLFGPAGPALIILVMLVAMISVHWTHGFFAQANGIELPLVYLTAALALAFAGPGSYSLDRVVGLAELARPATIWLAIAGAVVLALVNLALRRGASAPPPRSRA
jgi:putative oxidoreductase